MQGLVLQLTRAGFLMLLWLFIWSVLRESCGLTSTLRPARSWCGAD